MSKTAQLFNSKMFSGFLITAVINLAAVGLGNLTNFLLYCDMKPVALLSDCSAQCSCAESSFQPICDRLEKLINFYKRILTLTLFLTPLQLKSSDLSFTLSCWMSLIELHDLFMHSRLVALYSRPKNNESTQLSVIIFQYLTSTYN